MAHELSQPLAAVCNFIEGAIRRLDQNATESAVWGLREADRQAELAAGIIRSVREFVVKRDPLEREADLRDVLADAACFIELLYRNIVARHGGRIRAQRSATGGLDCRFALPLLLP